MRESIYVVIQCHISMVRSILPFKILCLSHVYVHVCVCVCVLVAQLCPTLCNPMDCSSPGSSVHGILQARVLEWGAISFSRIFAYLPPKTATVELDRLYYEIIF